MYCDIPNFGRCCFCLPLRRGVITFGYINLAFAIFMVVVYSITVTHDDSTHYLMYHGASTRTPVEICIFAYVLDIVFQVVLLFGAHTKRILYMKIFYYYTMTTILATLVLYMLEIVRRNGLWWIEEAALTLIGLCLQLYLVFLVRSVLKKLEAGERHECMNQLHQIVEGEVKVELNGVYNPNSVPNDV